MIIGLIVIAIGIVWLFSANGLLSSHTWDMIWALAVIIVGVWMIVRSQREKPWWRVFDNQSREDWERWGREFGSRVENWSRSIGQETGTQSKRFGQELGRQIEESVRKIFNNKAARQNTTASDAGPNEVNQAQNGK